MYSKRSTVTRPQQVKGIIIPRYTTLCARCARSKLTHLRYLRTTPVRMGFNYAFKCMECPLTEHFSPTSDVDTPADASARGICVSWPSSFLVKAKQVLIMLMRKLSDTTQEAETETYNICAEWIVTLN
ncbi:hypothetical protein CBL_07382 [Carabus blaptoides fortunei]